MIREESGGHGDDDRDKEPQHEQDQVLWQVKPRCACGRAILGHVESHSGSDTALEMSLNVADKGPPGPRAWAVSRVSAFARGCSSKPNCTAVSEISCVWVGGLILFRPWLLGNAGRRGW